MKMEKLIYIFFSLKVQLDNLGFVPLVRVYTVIQKQDIKPTLCDSTLYKY